MESKIGSCRLTDGRYLYWLLQALRLCMWFQNPLGEYLEEMQGLLICSDGALKNDKANNETWGGGH